MPEEYYRPDMPNPTPPVYFDTDIFPFTRSLRVGDKISVSFVGAVIGERIIEEDGTKIKRIRILNMRPLNDEKARL